MKMTDKVLGFIPSKKVQAVTTNNEKVWVVFEKDLVPVRLKSESVSKEDYEKLKELLRLANEEINMKVYGVEIKWLEKWCKRNAWIDIKEGKDGHAIKSLPHVFTRDLLTAAKKKAKEMER